jgi:HAE1 family hydrophobic/amphiphilic exporter-1
MLTIPMALVGVILGFVLTQRILGEMAMIGIIMLVGIVVSNAILLIDRINLLRSRGMALMDAILQGTKDRVRPVIMTKLTAILGMLPMALAIAEGSDLEAPLATAVISGLIFHTMVTLVLVPVLYSLFESARERRLARKAARLAKRLAKKQAKNKVPAAEL